MVPGCGLGGEPNAWPGTGVAGPPGPPANSFFLKNELLLFSVGKEWNGDGWGREAAWVLSVAGGNSLGVGGAEGFGKDPIGGHPVGAELVSVCVSFVCSGADQMSNVSMLGGGVV